jgi:hypothetical protein
MEELDCDTDPYVLMDVILKIKIPARAGSQFHAERTGYKIENEEVLLVS